MVQVSRPPHKRELYGVLPIDGSCTDTVVLPINGSCTDTAVGGNQPWKFRKVFIHDSIVVVRMDFILQLVTFYLRTFTSVPPIPRPSVVVTWPWPDQRW